MGIDAGAKGSSMATINVVTLIDILLVLISRDGCAICAGLKTEDGWRHGHVRVVNNIGGCGGWLKLKLSSIAFAQASREVSAFRP